MRSLREVSTHPPLPITFADAPRRVVVVSITRCESVANSRKNFHMLILLCRDCAEAGPSGTRSEEDITLPTQTLSLGQSEEPVHVPTSFVGSILRTARCFQKGTPLLLTLSVHSGRILEVVYLSFFLFIPVYYSANASSVLELADICELGHFTSPTGTDTSNSPQTPLSRGTDEFVSLDEGTERTTINTVSGPARSSSETLNGSTFSASSSQLQDAWATYIQLRLTEGKYLFSLSGIMIPYVDTPPSLLQC